MTPCDLRCFLPPCSHEALKWRRLLLLSAAFSLPLLLLSMAAMLPPLMMLGEREAASDSCRANGRLAGTCP